MVKLITCFQADVPNCEPDTNDHVSVSYLLLEQACRNTLNNKTRRLPAVFVSLARPGYW